MKVIFDTVIFDDDLTMKRTTSLSVIGISLGALTAIAVAALLIWYQLGNVGASVEAPQKAGFRPAIDIGGPFSLVDHTGAKVTEADFLGKYMLVVFGYTYCPDICPASLSRVSAALKKLDKKADRIQPVFVTIDPARDTPKLLSGYVSHFHPALKGLTGTENQIAQIAKAYRVFRKKVVDASSNDYLMDHSTFIYLMNPKGKLALMLRHETDPIIMAKAIEDEILGKR